MARAREALGLSIADVALQLKFAARQIEALERGRYQDLPAGTFARGMVRAYARLLKIDPEPLIGRIAPHVTAPDNTVAVAVVRRSIPIVDTRRRSNLVYAALSLGILGVVAAIAIEWQRESARASRMTFVAPAQAPAEVAPKKSEAVAVAAAAEARPLKEEAPSAVAGTLAQGERRIVMRFEAESWVEIRGAGGRLLTTDHNRAGTQRTVDGRPPFTLIIGNAQHVRVSYDDRPVDLSPHVKVEVARFTLE
jgi:cytoskeleton protein RodZ